MSEYGKQVKNQMDTYMNNPDSIDKEISDIQNATHGVEVRGALAAGVKKSFDKSKTAEQKSDEAYDITQNLLDETFDSATLEANFEQRLDDEIQNIQPEWTKFKTDAIERLDQNEKDINTIKHKKVYIEDYERLPEETDDTGRILRAFEDLNAYDTLVISGDYIANNLVFDKSDITIEFSGRIQQPDNANGVLLQIGASDKRTRRVKIEGMIKLNRNIPETYLPQNWFEVNSCGLKLVNLYESQIEIGTIERFKRGLVLTGNGSNGTVYNKIFINRIINNQENIRLESDEEGWVNNNEFFGGSLLWSSGVIAHPENKIETISEAITRLGTIDINITDYRMNNNIFYGTAMDTPIRDGDYLASGTFIKNEGRYNKFFGVRMEGKALKVYNGENSRFNEYNPAFLVGFDKGEHYVEEGTKNKIIGRDFMFLDGNVVELGRVVVKQSTAQLPDFTSDDGIVDLQSLSSNADKLFVGRDVNGEATSYIDANGNMHLDRSLSAYRGATFRHTTNTNLAINVQNTDGTSVFNVNGEGLISGTPKLPVLPSLPNAALNRGRILRIEGGSGSEDKVYISVKKSDNSYGWLQLSGNII